MPIGPINGVMPTNGVYPVTAVGNTDPKINNEQYASVSAVAYAGGQPSVGSNPSISPSISPATKVDTSIEVQHKKRIGEIQCQTCKNRKYQDVSNDPGVSFKAAGYIDPAAAGAVVQAHEKEHVTKEQSRAQSENREVVAQSVRIFTSVCPECGRVYVSGGETTTTTRAKPSNDPFMENYKKIMSADQGTIMNIRL